MLRIRKILYPTDFSPAAAGALSHALLLAEQFDAELHLLHAIVLHSDDPYSPAQHFPSDQEILRRLYEIAESQMAAIADLHRDRPVAIRQVQERGFSPADVILDYARDQDIDVIVMATHGRRGPRRLLMGSVAEEVARLAPCPVLTLHHHEGAELKVEKLARLLVPVDFSAHSELLLTYARELAAANAGRLTLLHVIQEHAYPYFYGPVSGPSLGDHLQELQGRAETALDELMAKSPGPQVPYDRQVVSGQPASEIVHLAADEAIDLIVIATHGLTGLERILVGSTAEQVLRSATCPVFTVKSFGKSLLAGDA